MTINLISCVINYKNKLGIGRNNGLLVRLKQDLHFFKTITSDSLSKDSRIDRNVVLMGRKTWFSIPRERRPLKNRLNLILTRDKDLMKLSPYEKKMTKNVYFISYKQFLDFYRKTNANVFIIGGADIYNLFLNNEDLKLRPSKVYITEVTNYSLKDNEPDVFMDHLDQSYRLVGFSEKYHDDGYNLDFRFLEYRFFPGFFTEEYKYIEMAKLVLTNGSERSDRTGVGTISIFGGNMVFDISDTVPLLTTKRVPWKHCIHELLWFMRGDTDNNILNKHGVKIWNGNTSREFLDKRGLSHYKEGILGPLYGWQWRFFGARYSQAFADTSLIDRSMIGGVDQLDNVIKLLKTDPFSRRIVMSYWNPPDFDKMVLLPCHYSIQFYVREHNNIRYLDCLFNMRSNDLFLGNPFNIFSYTVLVYILALKCDMKPGKLIYNGGDIHIYKNHIQQIEEQMSRNPRPFPKLKLNNEIKYKNIEDITIDDFDIIGYFPHASIRGSMAI